MKIKGITGDFEEIKLPTLAEAKRITKQFVTPFNDSMVLLVPKAPERQLKKEHQTEGVQVGAKAMDEIQGLIDNQGMLVVTIDPLLKNNPRYVNLKEGQWVFLNPGINAIGKMVVTGNNGQKYIIIVAPAHSLISTLTEPNYPME